MSSFASKGRFITETDFDGAVLDPRFVGTSENSGTAAIVVAKAGGVVGLITGASDGNRSMVNTGLNRKAEDGSINYVCIAMDLTAVTLRARFHGLTDTVSIENPIELSGVTLTSTATDAVGFVYDTAATTDIWYIQGVKADVDTPLKAAINPVTGGTYAPVAGAYNEFRIDVSVDGDADFYIDGAFVGRVENAVTPTVLLTDVSLNETRSGAAITTYVDYSGVEGARDQTP